MGHIGLPLQFQQQPGGAKFHPPYILGIPQCPQLGQYPLYGSRGLSKIEFLSGLKVANQGCQVNACLQEQAVGLLLQSVQIQKQLHPS